jgi:molybdopterin-guanine dinucleotide biosynthesis protein A
MAQFVLAGGGAGLHNAGHGFLVVFPIDMAVFPINMVELTMFIVIAIYATSQPRRCQ